MAPPANGSRSATRWTRSFARLCARRGAATGRARGGGRDRSPPRGGGGGGGGGRGGHGRRGGSLHHLIDPRTGSPAKTGLEEVSVVAEDGFEAEVVAKTALLLGP